jgi:hypothetical protein
VVTVVVLVVLGIEPRVVKHPKVSAELYYQLYHYI